MSQITQDKRLISISDFGLGLDTFLLTGFEGEEHISSLYAFKINTLSENLEHYEYPGLYDSSLGEHLVEIRMEVEEAPGNVVLGSSDCSTFRAGEADSLPWLNIHTKMKKATMCLSV